MWTTVAPSHDKKRPRIGGAWAAGVGGDSRNDEGADTRAGKGKVGGRCRNARAPKDGTSGGGR